MFLIFLILENFVHLQNVKNRKMLRNQSKMKN